MSDPGLFGPREETINSKASKGMVALLAFLFAIWVLGSAWVGRKQGQQIAAQEKEIQVLNHPGILKSCKATKEGFDCWQSVDYTSIIDRLEDLQKRILALEDHVYTHHDFGTSVPPAVLRPKVKAEDFDRITEGPICPKGCTGTIEIPSHATAWTGSTPKEDNSTKLATIVMDPRPITRVCRTMYPEGGCAPDGWVPAPPPATDNGIDDCISHSPLSEPLGDAVRRCSEESIRNVGCPGPDCKAKIVGSEGKP